MNEELMFVNHNGGSRKLFDDDIDEDTKTLSEYFQLHISCEKLVFDWSQKDRTIANVSKAALGVRILKQDPVETLIAFICSSNNNIPRITSMVNKLCIHYGTLLGIHSGKEFYSFPRLKDLIGESVEDKLRELGFGYRAKYVVNAARYILDNHGPHWLNSLREVAGYEEAWLALQDVPGVGPKVADCVCLMALGKAEAVPIDTHILQVAVKEYGVKVKGKSLTLRRYKEIGITILVVCIFSSKFHNFIDQLLAAN